MTKHWSQNYYTNQAGNGMSGFQGVKYQRGHGFFGSIFSKILKPLAKYLGKQALSTGVDLGKDVLKGDNFKEAAIKRLKLAKDRMFEDGVERARTFSQTGKGRKRKKPVKTTSKKGSKKCKRGKKKTKAKKPKKKARKRSKTKAKKVKKKQKSKKVSFGAKKSASEQLKYLF